MFCLSATIWPSASLGTSHPTVRSVFPSVTDPDPNPDPYVFGPPESGSGSTSHRYGSGSFYHQAKIVRKTLIPAVL